MNVFLSRLDEQQRRWYVALEAEKLGHGGIKKMSQITGMEVGTIRRGAGIAERFGRPPRGTNPITRWWTASR